MKKLFIAVLLLFPLTLAAGEIKLYGGVGVFDHTDGAVYGVGVEVPQYANVIVGYDRWEDNYVYSLSYKFKWNPLYATVGLGLAGHQNDGIHDSQVYRVEAGIRLMKYVEAGVVHWSSPGDDSGENAFVLGLVNRW